MNANTRSPINTVAAAAAVAVADAAVTRHTRQMNKPFAGLRQTLTLLLITLTFATAHAQVDRGEPPAPTDLLALGDDVTQTIGAPAGRPVSGIDLDRHTDELTARMRCPVCQGHAIVDSPSETARNMKRQVRAMIAAGYQEAQIMAYFEASYGEFIRLLPRPAGFNLLVWILPVAVLLIGALWGVWFVLRRRNQDVEPPAAEPQVEVSESSPWLDAIRSEVAGDNSKTKERQS